MRCINCGRETGEGQWNPDGFVCEVCIESYDYGHCEGCGLEFPRARMKEHGGGAFCETCYKGVIQGLPGSKPKTPPVKDQINEVFPPKARWKGFKALKFPSILSRLAKLIAGDDDEETPTPNAKKGNGIKKNK